MKFYSYINELSQQYKFEHGVPANTILLGYYEFGMLRAELRDNLALSISRTTHSLVIFGLKVIQVELTSYVAIGILCEQSPPLKSAEQKAFDFLPLNSSRGMV